MSTGLSTVIVYTTNQQTEQGITLRDVVALAVSGGRLTVESRANLPGLSYDSYHTYDDGKWTHFEVHPQGF